MSHIQSTAPSNSVTGMHCIGSTNFGANAFFADAGSLVAPPDVRLLYHWRSPPQSDHQARLLTGEVASALVESFGSAFIKSHRTALTAPLLKRIIPS